ncbi:hypothetical protein NT04LM_0302, partial [Listeria monocytogenes FSL F2-208]
IVNFHKLSSNVSKIVTNYVYHLLLFLQFINSSK